MKSDSRKDFKLAWEGKESREEEGAWVPKPARVLLTHMKLVEGGLLEDGKVSRRL